MPLETRLTPIHEQNSTVMKNAGPVRVGAVIILALGVATAGIVGISFLGGQAHAGLKSASAAMPAAMSAVEQKVVEQKPVLPVAVPAVELMHEAAPVALVEVVAAEPAKPVKMAAVAKKPRMVWMEVTAYCACTKCCGDDARGVTASGKTVKHDRGRFVAADTKYFPFGTKLSIPDYHEGRPVEVIDRGGDIKGGSRLDVFFPRHADAMEFGRRWVKVAVVEKK